jgi:hypothetical protein
VMTSIIVRGNHGYGLRAIHRHGGRWLRCANRSHRRFLRFDQ